MFKSVVGRAHLSAPFCHRVKIKSTFRPFIKIIVSDYPSMVVNKLFLLIFSVISINSNLLSVHGALSDRDGSVQSIQNLKRSHVEYQRAKRDDDTAQGKKKHFISMSSIKTFMEKYLILLTLYLIKDFVTFMAQNSHKIHFHCNHTFLSPCNYLFLKKIIIKMPLSTMIVPIIIVLMMSMVILIVISIRHSFIRIESIDSLWNLNSVG